MRSASFVFASFPRFWLYYQDEILPNRDSHGEGEIRAEPM